jgi:probable DNA metabolism protein
VTILEYPYTFPQDGGLRGFLCAVFEAYRLKAMDPFFRCSGGPELSFRTTARARAGGESAAARGSSGSAESAGQAAGLFDEIVPVAYSAERASRVAEGIRSRGGPEAWFLVVRAFLSDMEERESTIFRFIRSVMDGGGSKTANRLDLSEAVHVRRAAGRTGNEAHKFLGILRFVKYGDIYYAAIEPDCRILSLVAEHFRNRFADQEWVIHDLRRAEALFWDRRTLSFETGVTADPPTDEDSFFAGLWKTYFSAAAIRERRNLDLQRRFVPIKYRSHMTEME